MCEKSQIHDKKLNKGIPCVVVHAIDRVLQEQIPGSILSSLQ